MEMYMNIMQEIIGGTVIPTKLMYATNMSWKPFQLMLRSLIDRDLVVECESEMGDDRSRVIYGVTEKGRHVVEYFGKAQALVEKKKPVEIMNWR